MGIASRVCLPWEKPIAVSPCFVLFGFSFFAKKQKTEDQTQLHSAMY
jgi:hypothetical protein